MWWCNIYLRVTLLCNTDNNAEETAAFNNNKYAFVDNLKPAREKEKNKNKSDLRH